MVNEITNGIALSLTKACPNYKIYIDDVQQGLNRPCFFIALVEANQTQHLGRRLWREHLFDIHYFPKKEDDNREINAVLDTLRLCLRYVAVKEDNGQGEGLVRGTDMRHEVVDSVLHFFVNYNVFVLLPAPDDPYMETLDHVVTLR